MFSFLLQPANSVLLQSICKLFLISFLGYSAVRCKILSSQAVACLSKFVIAIALPCLIISTLGNDLEYSLLPQMALCLATALGLNLLGFALALIGRKLIMSKDQPGYRLFLSLAAMQNSGYLPIPLVTAVLPKEQHATGLLFTFVYMLVMGFIFWSLGVWLIGRNNAPTGFKQNLRNMENPPMMAMLVCLLFLFPPVKSAFDALPLLQETLNIVGSTTIPLVLIVLGGSLAEKLPPLNTGRLMIAGASGLKLIVIPAMVLFAISMVRPDPVFAFVMMLQSSMPAAMNHIVVAQEYDGNVQLTSRALFVQYILALFTVPFFLIIFNLIYSA